MNTLTAIFISVLFVCIQLLIFIQKDFRQGLILYMKTGNLNQFPKAIILTHM